MLNGKSALVTGSSQGIGLGVAQAFAASGAKVIVTSEKPLATCPDVQRLLSDYEHTRYIHADLLQDGEPERLVAEAWAAFGGIDVLVNNLGTYKEPPLAGPDPRPLRLHLPAQRLDSASRSRARWCGGPRPRSAAAGFSSAPR